MINRNVYVIGYFGYDTNQLDGQTIKTRNIFALLQNKYDNINFYDTQSFRKKPFSIFNVIIKLIKCERLIIIPAQNNLVTIFPLAFIMSRIFSFKIIHIAVGGWLDVFCFKHKIIRMMLKYVDAILLENKDTIFTLKNIFGFSNVEYLHNYRLTKFQPTFYKHNTDNLFRIVFMARIHHLKGLDVVFDIADYYSKKDSNNIIIDFYGPIFDDDRNYFEQQLLKYSFVKYKGKLDPKEINATLNNYDLMILPTRYYTEGFPGSVLDAYISGIPVLVSNWKHASEYVVDQYNGFIRETSCVKDFIDVIELLRKDTNLTLQMKHNAYESSKKYDSNEAWNIIKKYI